MTRTRTLSFGVLAAAFAVAVPAHGQVTTGQQQDSARAGQTDISAGSGAYTTQTTTPAPVMNGQGNDDYGSGLVRTTRTTTSSRRSMRVSKDWNDSNRGMSTGSGSVKSSSTYDNNSSTSGSTTYSSGTVNNGTTTSGSTMYNSNGTVNRTTGQKNMNSSTNLGTPPTPPVTSTTTTPPPAMNATPAMPPMTPVPTTTTDNSTTTTTATTEPEPSNTRPATPPAP